MIQSLAFGMTMLASSCLNNVFVSYYFEMFTSVARITSGWFYFAQFIFCVWNCGNDVMFGWVSDRAQCCSSENSVRGLRRRLLAIAYGGPIWVIAFLSVFWWPFDPTTATEMQTGLYCIFALCFYDGMLTFVELNHSALLADMTASSQERARANMYSAMCAAVGSASSFFAHTFWTPEDLAPFHNFCCILGLIACAAFWFTSKYIDTAFIKRRAREAAAKREDKSQHSMDGVGKKAERDKECDRFEHFDPSPDVGFSSFLGQLYLHQNFKLFCVFYTLQVFDCTFEKNFLATFLRHFAGTSLSIQSQSTIISMSFVLPWITTIFVTPIVERSGVYATIMNILIVRILISAIGVTYAVVFRQTSWIYLLVNRVSSECICRLIPLIISDLTDEDMHLNRRASSLSASVIGSSGVIGKIGQSAAPMLGYMLYQGSQSCGSIGDGDEVLNGIGHMDITSDDMSSGIQNLASGALIGVDDCQSRYHTYIAPNLIALIPLTVVCCQVYLWHHFSLHGAYLTKVKASRMLSGQRSFV